MNNKKTLVGALLVAIIGLIGLTIAFFTDSVEIPNKFKTKPYRTSVIEEFVSPDNWTPGTTTTKRVYATNDGDVDAAVRVSVTEEWVSANQNILSNTIDGENVAILNLSDNGVWVKEGDYYYYNKKLTKGNSSSSFLESVTFNPNVPSDSICSRNNLTDSTTNEVIGKQVTCESSGDGYDGATYTLTIRVETVQYDLYKEVWNTNIEIN